MWLVDAIFPRFCCHCQSMGSLLCEHCYSQIEFSSLSSRSEFCTSVSAVTQFGAVTQSIVHCLKYKNVREVAILCARIMYLSGLIPSTDLITAIPIHKMRYNTRGFNQAEQIALELSRLLCIPYEPLLKRKTNDVQLAKVSEKKERKKLIEKSFCLQAKISIKSKYILLIDDVWTTGATLEAAAQVIKNADAESVHGLTFTHGV